MLKEYGGHGHFVVVGSVKRGEAVSRSDLDLADLVPGGIDKYPDVLAIREVDDHLFNYDLQPKGFHLDLIGIYHEEYDF